MDNQKKIEIAIWCHKLVTGEVKPLNNRFGLCFNINEMFEVDLDDLVDVTKYPNYSGDKDYPIPHPERDPARAYSRACGDMSMWYTSTEYGAERLMFCQWVSDTIRGKIT